MGFRCKNKGAAGNTVAPSLREGALTLAADGHPVLPLEPVGKAPLAGLGLTHATTDATVIEHWWKTWPRANIGLRCDGLVVIDVDGGTGEESLARLESAFGRLPATRGQETGKGRHLLFTVEIPIGNSTGPLGRPPGIDLRGGARGYIVAAPSVHASGRIYSWICPERSPAPLSAGWVKQLCRRRAEPRTVQTSHIFDLDHETAYGRAALEGELERLLRARDGERNETLNAVVFRLAQLVAGNQLPLARVEREAFELALLLGLESRETRNTIASAVTAGLRFPRVPRAHAHAREISGGY